MQNNLQNKANSDIRAAIMARGLRQWQVADAMGLHDVNFTKLLRKELPLETKSRIMQHIRELKGQSR